MDKLRRIDMKILILKSDEDDFERYFSERMKRKNIDVYSAESKINGTIKRVIRKISCKFGILFIYGLYLNRWKYRLSEYDEIIIFDKDLNYSLCRWIKHTNQKCKIKIWYWNVPKIKTIRKFRNITEQYCFDAIFARNQGIKYIPQFYIPEKPDQLSQHSFMGISYVGYDKDRYDKLSEFANKLDSENIYHEFRLLKEKGKYYPLQNNIILIEKPMNYTDVLSLTKKYNCILELTIEKQKGLTLRTMEALFYDKKLITNNDAIESFPFYNSNNIYIIGKDSRSIKEFLTTPMKKIDNRILFFYSYDNWLKRITK